MASAISTSKEDPTVQLWDFVQVNLLQFHCENVSWEQASDKIPIKVVVELLGDLITHVNTCLLLRNNRLLFTLNWDTFENGPGCLGTFAFISFESKEKVGNSTVSM